MITQEQTRKTVHAHRVHAKDTGSSSVQVALLTDRILYLSEHLKIHPKDNHSRRGLLQMVSHRSSLLRYLSRTEPKRHASLLEKLGIRK